MATPTITPGSIEDKVRKATILLVDDHPVTRQGLSVLINRQPHLEVCGEAESTPRALELVGKLRPSLVIADISLKTSSGIELVKSIKAQDPKLPVLVMSMHEENMYASRVLKAGARGYIMKQDASDRIVEAINRLLQGELYLSERIQDKILKGFMAPVRDNASFLNEDLTDRELEIIQLLGNGFGTAEIAKRLYLSKKTIDSYRDGLKSKLKVKGRNGLVKRAIQWVRSEKM